MYKGEKYVSTDANKQHNFTGLFHLKGRPKNAKTFNKSSVAKETRKVKRDTISQSSFNSAIRFAAFQKVAATA